jgi:hypothetical protein
MKNTIKIITQIIGIALIMGSCEKDDESSKLNAVYSYYADGFSVSFTNFSTKAKSYVWNFNDGSEESNLKNPVHVFHGKGNYIVKLTAVGENKEDVFEDTVKVYGPSIKIDGDFTDWTYVDYSLHNDAAAGGTLVAIKTLTYGPKINIYLEGTQDMNLAVFDMFVNADNDPGTGFLSWQWPVSSGADYLFEGNAEAGFVYNNTDPAHGWTWVQVSTFSEVCSFSDIKVVGDLHAMEFSIDKTKIGNPSGYLTLAITELDATWTAIGSMPAKELPTSEFLQVKL